MQTFFNLQLLTFYQLILDTYDFYSIDLWCCCSRRSSSSSRCPKLLPFQSASLLSPHFVILLCSTGGAGTIAAGRRGRAHPTPQPEPQQHRCLNTRWTTKKRVVAYLNTERERARESARERGFVCVGGCVALQVFSLHFGTSELLAVVHLMYILVWMPSGHGVKYQTPRGEFCHPLLCLSLGKKILHTSFIILPFSYIEIKPCLWFLFLFRLSASISLPDPLFPFHFFKII